LLTEKGVGAAIMEFVDKEEKEAINELFKYQVDRTQSYLMTQEVDEDTVDDEVVKYRHEVKNAGQEDEDMEHVIQAARTKARQSGSTDRPSDPEMDVDVSDASDPGDEDITPQRGRGRGRAQARATGRGSRGGRANGTARSPRASRGRGRGSRVSTAAKNSILPFTTRRGTPQPIELSD